MSIITLVSGGIDSSLMALLVKEEKIAQYPLFIDYGQRARKIEWQSCRSVLSNLGIPKPTKMNLSGYGKLISSGLTNRKLRIYEDAFLPGRNFLFLLAAAAYAYEKNCNSIAIGLLSEKYHLFPDQTSQFMKLAEKTLWIATGRKISVITPLMKFSKTDAINLAKKKGIKGTYSCHSGQVEPCGKCISCLEILNSTKTKGQ